MTSLGFVLGIDGEYSIGVSCTWLYLTVIVHDRMELEMPRTRDTYSPSTNLPADMEPRVKALAEHRGQSVSGTIADAVRDAVLQFEGDDTNRQKMKRIEHKIDMLLLLAWRGVADGKVEITADDVRTLKALLAEIPL